MMEKYAEAMKTYMEAWNNFARGYGSCKSIHG